MPLFAAMDWIGIVIFLIVILAQVIGAMRRGKTDPDEEEMPSPSPRPTPRETEGRPAPATLPKSLEQLFEELSKGMEPTPEPPKPAPAPVPVRKPLPVPVPVPVARPLPPPVVRAPLAREMEEADAKSLANNFAASEPLFVTAIEKMTHAEDVTYEHGGEPKTRAVDWLHERLRDRSEVQRAIVLNEVLQPSLAMR
jgi:hypothetical protein